MQPLDLVNALSAVVSAVAAVVSAAVSVRTLGAQRRSAQAQHLRPEDDMPPNGIDAPSVRLPASGGLCPSPV